MKNDIASYEKLAEKLNLSPLPEPTTDELYSWRANYVQGYGFRFVVFMNDASRFTIVINEAKAAKLKKLPELFIQTLRETFLAFSSVSQERKNSGIWGRAPISP